MRSIYEPIALIICLFLYITDSIDKKLSKETHTRIRILTLLTIIGPLTTIFAEYAKSGEYTLIFYFSLVVLILLSGFLIFLPIHYVYKKMESKKIEKNDSQPI